MKRYSSDQYRCCHSLMYIGFDFLFAAVNCPVFNVPRNAYRSTDNTLYGTVLGESMVKSLDISLKLFGGH